MSCYFPPFIELNFKPYILIIGEQCVSIFHQLFEIQEGWTALHCAANAGYLDVAKLLVESGASSEVFSLIHKTQYSNLAVG